jgi:hypothetical protein
MFKMPTTISNALLTTTFRRSVLLPIEQQNMQFQFHASGLAVYVVLRCKQHCLEPPTGKSVMALGWVILVDTPRFPFALSEFI